MVVAMQADAMLLQGWTINYAGARHKRLAAATQGDISAAVRQEPQHITFDTFVHGLKGG